MAKTLIQKRKVVTAKETKAADVLIDGEQIKEVRRGIPAHGRGQGDRREGAAT